MLVSDRDGYVLPLAMYFRSVNEVYTVPYPIEQRAQIMELLVGWARERHAVAIGRIFQSVRSGSTQRLSKGLPRDILPSGLLFVPDRPPMRERVKFPPLDSQQFRAFSRGQVEAIVFHASSLGGE